MPSFDIASEPNMHEVSNAVDQANREVTTRFDFKGSNAEYSIADGVINLQADSEFQVKQMLDILRSKLSKRNVDLKFIKPGPIHESGKGARQELTLQQGIEAETGKKISKMIRDSKMKVQASIQGDKVRVSGKKRDDLQEVIQMLKGANIEIPLQFENYRD